MPVIPPIMEEGEAVENKTRHEYDFVNCVRPPKQGDGRKWIGAISLEGQSRKKETNRY